jgi:pyruvate formate lyase activating enzyme
MDGLLKSVVYSFPSALHLDPIEKKPLFHFLPGTKIVSLATVGCNLHCLNCQNWEISQANPEESEAFFLPPEKVVELAIKYQAPSIAYTYTDPVIYYEYAYETARLAREKNIRNVLVTAGYINPMPWRKLLEYTDAANIDLKGITDKFYREVCSATLKPVLTALVLAKDHGIELEVTNLVIPTLNDSPEHLRELALWIKNNLGSETPLHFSAFHPRYKMNHLPPTSPETLQLAREIALSEGLHHVYVGNVLSKEGQNTYCSRCKKLLVERQGYWIGQYRVKDGCCPDCNTKLYGVWR